MKRSALILAFGLAVTACGGESAPQGPLDGVDSVVFLQRAKRGGTGDIFNYTFYEPGGRLVTLTPPTADGELEVICCDQDEAFAQADISGYDLSFDAREIVFSAKLGPQEHYGLYLLSLDSGEITAIPGDPNEDYIQPAFLPGDRIFFTTSAVVEDGTPQFRDEYERRVTSQIGIINRDGTEETLGPRNLSHRVFPTVLSDGRVMLTHWNHLGEMNAGHLVVMNPDMTRMREAFGKEGTGVTNSYLKAVEIAPGRVIAVGTSRDRTVQSGALIDIRLGEVYSEDGELRADRNMSEENATYSILTPQVPLGNEPSFQNVGRYYDAYPLDSGEYPNLLTSWADGPVEDASLEAGGLDADFGIYLYDSQKGLRRPVWNDANRWDVFPRPLVSRSAPPVIPDSASNEIAGDAVLLGSTNVYESSLDSFEAGSIYGVRVLEGFSSEEGLPRDFGLTEHEGSSQLGIAQVRDDGSWAALIPPNVPIHSQVIDRFGMSLRSEPIWISGRKGESLFCNGCHEDRARTTVLNPGVTEAVIIGPNDLRSTEDRSQRQSSDFSIDAVAGVPWDTALQPIFDAKCVSCHDGDAAKEGNPSYTITDPESGESFTWTFDLSGNAVEIGVGETLFSGYSASHLSLMGPGPEVTRDLEKAGLELDADIPVFVIPSEARNSRLLQKLNPPQLFPETDTDVRAFDTAVHGEEQGFTLTADEYYLLILMADSGGQFYSRENAPSETANAN